MLGNVRRKGQGEGASWLRRHSLGIVLVALLLVQMVGYHFTVLPTWVAERQAHGQPTALWPNYWQYYASKWFFGLMADTYGALLLVLMTKWFYEERSAESSSPEQSP